MNIDLMCFLLIYLFSVLLVGNLINMFTVGKLARPIKHPRCYVFVVF